jgi:FG-GAP-like repeat
MWRTVPLLTLTGWAFAQDLSDPVFQRQSIDEAIRIGYGLAVADVNGDGKPDLVLADKTDIVWYANPKWQKHVIASRLTLMDNVCVAARDIDGDGKAEIAVGAQWNPGETTDETKSGAVFYLIRPVDPTQRWTPVKLTHEPTVHRMKWVRTGDRQFKLVVVPLHGRGNNPQTGEGDPVKVLAYDVPADVSQPAGWKTTVVDATMHKTHNLDVKKARSGPESLWLGGKEGVSHVSWSDGGWSSRLLTFEGLEKGVGEVRGAGSEILAVVQPMHGNQLAVYHDQFGRAVLDESLNQGHALVCQSLLGRGFPEVVVGWREKNSEGKVGVKMFVRDDSSGRESWKSHVIDDNTMACEDMLAADLDGDNKPDLVAAGRATHNVVIYWNKTSAPPAATNDRPPLPPLSAEEKAKAIDRATRIRAEQEKPANGK